MKNRIGRVLAVSATLATAMFAQNNQQNFPRQATMVGGGGPDRGKCTVEVVVDDVAQVEIRGNTATLRTISGQPPQWRRFECTGVMPANPANFRFSGVDGRGNQVLVRDPRNGGVAVVQIEDKEGGAEGYTFDITWDARGPMTSGNPNGQFQGGNPNGQFQGGNQQNNQNRDRVDPNPPRAYGDQQQPAYGDQNRNRNDEQYRPNYRDTDYYRRYGHAFGTDEAIRVCQQAVLTQATRRFRTNDVHFHGTQIEDNPGRQDYIKGTIDAHRGNHEERYGFSCAVNFDTGRVRTADLDMRPLPDDTRWH